MIEGGYRNSYGVSGKEVLLWTAGDVERRGYDAGIACGDH